MGLRLGKTSQQTCPFQGQMGKGRPLGGSASESTAKGEAEGVQFRNPTQTQDPHQRQDLLLGGVSKEEKPDKT